MIRLGFPVLAVLLLANVTGAADPLEFVPASAGVVVVADNPRKLAEAVTGLDAFKQAQQLAPVRATLRLHHRAPAAADARVRREGTRREVARTARSDSAATASRSRSTSTSTPRRRCSCFPGRTRSRSRRPTRWRSAWSRRNSPGRVRRRSRCATRSRASRPRGSATTPRARDRRHDPRVEQGRGAQGRDRAGDADSSRSRASTRPARDAAKVLPKDPLAWLWLDFAAVKETQAGEGLLRRDPAGLPPDARRRRDHRLPQAVGLPRRRAVPGADRLPAAAAHPRGPRRDVGRTRAARPAEGHARHAAAARTAGRRSTARASTSTSGYMWKNRDKLINAAMPSTTSRRPRRTSRRSCRRR